MGSLTDIYAVDNITHAAKLAARTNSGGATFDTPTDQKAKVIYEELVFTSPQDGRQKTSKVQLRVNPSFTITGGDKVVVDSLDYFVEMVRPVKQFKKIVGRKCFLINASST